MTDKETDALAEQTADEFYAQRTGKTPVSEAKPEPVRDEAQEPDPDPDESDADGDEGLRQEGRPKRKGVSAKRRIAQLTAKNHDLERRLQELETKAAQAPAPQPKERPKSEDFDDQDAYTEALTDWKIEQREQDREARSKASEAQQKADQETRERQDRVRESFKAARDIYDDFDELVFDDSVEFSETLVSVLSDAENPGEVAYLLAEEPELASKLSRMSAARAAMEIGKIEARLARDADAQDKAEESTKEPVQEEPKPTTKAPPPPKTVRASGSVSRRPIEAETDMNAYYERRTAQLRGK